MKNLLNSIKGNVVQFRSEERKVGRAERRKAIAELRSLSDSQLKDMGITRSSISHSVDHGRDLDRAA